MDKSGANLAALKTINAERETPIKIRQNKYLNNVVEQDHRAVKRILHPMLKFESFRTMLTNTSLPCLLSHIAAQPVWQREAK